MKIGNILKTFVLSVSLLIVSNNQAFAVAHLDNINSYLSVSPSFFNTPSWTYSAKIQVDNPNAGDDGSIMMQAGDACNFWDFGFGTNPNGTLRIEASPLDFTPPNISFSSGTTMIGSGEHLYTLVYDSSTLKMYIDGVFETQIDPSFAITLTNPLALGNYNSNCDISAVGNYSDAKWWNTALTNSEVQSLAAGLTPQVSGLVANWPLDSDAIDIVGNHNFTVNGSVTFTPLTPTPTATPTPTPTATPTPTPTPVPNVAPVVTNVSAASSLILLGGTANMSGTFTDANASDTHTATWNWGDSTTSSGAVTESNGAGSVAGTHIYSATGVYTVTLTVKDNYNSQNSQTYQYIAVYDLSTSFAGGRSYDNPSSAIPTTNGKVTFGISAKYNNSGVLTGSLKMNFKLANMDFVSNSLTSLATSNGHAYLKGVGAFNGNSGYTFLASGIDGSVVGGSDLVRIQIKDSFGFVVYDSQPGDSDTTNPSTFVNTGNVRIN